MASFIEPKPAHDVLRDKVFGKAEEERQWQLAEAERRRQQENEMERIQRKKYVEESGADENDDWGSAPASASSYVSYRPYDRANEVLSLLFWMHTSCCVIFDVLSSMNELCL